MRPGEYYEVTDGYGRTTTAKVPYTREWIETHYEMVDFCPPRTTLVTVHGIRWMLTDRVHQRVPSIVKDVAMQSFESDTAQPKRWTIEMDEAVAKAAVDNPGKKMWTPLVHMGYGFFKPDHLTDAEYAKVKHLTHSEREHYETKARVEAEHARPWWKRLIAAVR